MYREETKNLKSRTVGLEVDFAAYISNQQNSAVSFTNYNYIAKTSQQILFERLNDIMFTPESTPVNILNLGSKVGELTKELCQKFPKSNIYELELTDEMLKVSKELANKTNTHNLNYVKSDFEKLPFVTAGFDLILSNQALLCFDFASVMQEIYRVLSNNGIFLFSALGPDSFKQLRHAWGLVDNFAHIYDFCDMHIFGDILKKTGFIDPVMDCHWVEFQYKSLQQIFLDLKGMGEQYIDIRRRKSLTGKNKFLELERVYERNSNKRYPVSIEYIFGHAIKPKLSNINKANSAGRVKVPVSSVGLL